MAIAKVAVIGAGVMGAGIAAHVANAGVPVVLLDIVPKGAANRNAIAEGAVEQMLKTEPGALHEQVGGATGHAPAISRTISACSPIATGSSRR